MEKLLLESPLGTIEFSLSADCVSKSVKYRIESHEVSPPLPNGMTVDSCVAIKAKILNSQVCKDGHLYYVRYKHALRTEIPTWVDSEGYQNLELAMISAQDELDLEILWNK